MRPHRAVAAADVGIGREHGDAQTTTGSQEVLEDFGDFTKAGSSDLKSDCCWFFANIDSVLFQ